MKRHFSPLALIAPLLTCGLLFYFWLKSGRPEAEKPVFFILGPALLGLYCLLPRWFSGPKAKKYLPLQFATIEGKFTWIHGPAWFLWHLSRGFLPAAIIALSAALAGFTTISVENRRDLDLALVYDYSGSMEAREEMGYSRRELALALSRRLIGESGAGAIAIIGFAHKAVLLSPLTADFSLLRQIIERPAPNLDDGTAIGDALMVAIAHLAQGAATHKKIVILSDGANNSGLITLDEAIAAAKELNIEIHGALIGSTHPLGLAPPAEAHTLAAIAEKSGGKLWFLSAGDELIATLAKDLPLRPAAGAKQPRDFASPMAFLLLLLTALGQYGRLRAHD